MLGWVLSVRFIWDISMVSVTVTQNSCVKWTRKWAVKWLFQSSTHVTISKAWDEEDINGKA